MTDKEVKMFQPVNSISDSSRDKFYRSLRQALTELAIVYDKAGSLLSVWYARDYANDTTNDYSTEFGKTDAQNAIYLLDSMKKFLEGQDVPKEQFVQTLSKYRTDI